MPDSSKHKTILPYQSPAARTRSMQVMLSGAAALVVLLSALALARRPHNSGIATGIAVPVPARAAMALAAADAPAAGAPAGGSAIPAGAPAAGAENLEQGLTLTITPANAPGNAPGNALANAAGDSRSARLVSLFVPEGAAATPFVAPGRFVATWQGYLNMKIRDSYSFMARGRGKVTVTINEKPALEAAGDDLSTKQGEALRLNKGKNRLVVRYESPEKGDAQIRLFWLVSDDQTKFYDPVPPHVFKHDVSAEPLATHLRLREGRQMLAELRCTRCHAAPEAQAPVGAPAPAGHAALSYMPELSMDAPNLSDVGARLRLNWLAAWVNDPRSLRPDAHMPRLFHDDKSPKDSLDQRALDVAAYLATLNVPAAPAAPAAPVAPVAPAAAPKPPAKVIPTAGPPKAPGFEASADAAPASGAPAAPAAAPASDPLEAGGRLFVNLNCTGCHTPPEKVEAPAAADAGGGETPAGAGGQEGGNAATFPRVPLEYVAEKYKPDALKQYLLRPEGHYAWNPMPNFRLSDAEAGELAAYLLKNGVKSLPIPASQGNAANGKKLVESSGCLDCHAMGQSKSTLKAPALAEIPKDGWDKGCLAKDDAGRKGAPDYVLKDEQRAALSAFAATDRSSLKRDSAVEFAERQIASMHCGACHMRDGRESLLATAYSDEFKSLQDKHPNPPPSGGPEAFAPDQRAPQLTWVGEKLRPEWMEKFIAGQIPYKPRTYLYARMPGFVARGALIADGLAEEHGCEITLPEDPKPNDKAPVGQKLVGKTPNQAFACVQCHAIANVPPFAPFEAPAINFMYARERLRKDYYHRWVHNPLKVDPNTKMPAFERDNGTTAINSVENGDARAQFEDIWQYLLTGRDIKPPAE